MKKEKRSDDEVLLLRFRLGDAKADAELTRRYISKAECLGRKASPEFYPMLEYGQFMALFAETLYNGMRKYRFGKGRFSYFLLKLLNHEIPKEAMRVKAENARKTPLDSKIDSDGTLVFHDVIGDRGATNAVTYLVDTMDTLAMFDHLPKGVDEQSLRILKMRLDGLSEKEISDREGISVKTVYRKFVRLKEYAKKYLSLQDDDL